MDDAHHRGMGAALYQVSGRRPQDRTMPRLVSAVLILGLFVPILAGLAAVASASFGHLPAIGAREVSLAPWQQLFGLAGLATAVRLTVFTGVAAALLSLILALALAATLARRMGRFARWITPFLAMPHAALAIGLAFVLAPSGMIARILAPMLNWARPPDLASVNDAFGLALIAGLVIKEMPFLLLAILAALTQIPLRQSVALGASLGYGRAAVWALVIFPQIWPMLRLPFFVVLAYGLSVVDMALILGPLNPPTLPVMVTRLYASTQSLALLPASAGAVLIAVLVGLGIWAAYLAERLIARSGAALLRAGKRREWLEIPLRGLGSLALGLLGLGAAAMLALGLWSLAWRWTWPQLLPQEIRVQAWRDALGSGNIALQNTATLAGASTAIALILAILWLEARDRLGRDHPFMSGHLIFLPLILPQIAFLFGMNILALRLGANGSFAAVIWAHEMFVFPYVMLALEGPWRGLDPRHARSAASLGAGPWRVLLAVKLPILLAPICTAAAVGIAVSVAQYLPTLFLGAGRITTLTTEAVTLASSSNRRVTAVVATLQAALPLLAYAAAIALPRLMHKNRRHLLGLPQT